MTKGNSETGLLHLAQSRMRGNQVRSTAKILQIRDEILASSIPTDHDLAMIW